MSERIGPVEVTTRYVANVPDLTSAWAFVMEKVDAVGPDPTIEIKPVWVISMADADRDLEDTPRHFSVVVEGMVEEQEPRT